MQSLQKKMLILKPASWLFGEEHMIKGSTPLTMETEKINSETCKEKYRLFQSVSEHSQSKCGDLCKSIKIIF